VSDAFSEPVSLVGPDPEWSGQYAAEAALIERVAVRAPDVALAVDALRALAYEHHGQGGVRGREYLIKRPAQGPDFNVHVFAAGNPLLNDNRMIRDYLREHPTATREYEQIKDRAVEQGHVDLRSYSHAKGAHVAAVREAAYAWTRRTQRSG
jgi:GrpB-like predicted nucleotidyltransferase (UPF0157 family)